MKKLLSIDDEPMMLRCLSRALKGKGYDLTITTDPEEGLNILKKENDICLALLDVKMPGKNGFEIYRELMQFKKIPVLFVTAYPRAFTTKSDEVVEMWRNEFADGTTDIIYKPFDLPSLFEKVEGLIGQPGESGETR
jgi:two-component system OmpR family response regulator